MCACVLLAVLGFISCASSTKTAQSVSNQTTQNAITVHVLATSDMHGYFVPWDFSEDVESTRGAMTYLATVIKQQRAKNPNTILVDCGDTVQSNYVEYFIGRKSNPMIQGMNALGYDIWTFGNHEYNFGIADRKKLTSEFKGTTLSGNVFMKKTGKPYLPATTIIERDGVKIGFIGMTTPLIVEFERSKTTLNEVAVKNPMDCIADAIASLKEKGVHAIVGIIHEGLEEENNVYGSGTKDIAEAFPDFDVIISGHAHVAVESERVNGVLLCEPNCYARNLSVIALSFKRNENTWNLDATSATLLAAGKDEDEELAKLLKPYKDELRTFVNTPIGKLINADLSEQDVVPGIAAANVNSVPMLNLMSTAGIYYSGADFTLYNPTYEHPGCTIGGISIKNISSSFQYTTGEISVYPITGKQLKTILEWSAGYFNTWHEDDLTVSFDPKRRESKYSSNFIGGGIAYTVDLTQEQGNRIKNLMLIAKDASGNPTYNADGSFVQTPIDDNTTVKMGTHDYYVRQWVAKAGCLEGQTLSPIYSTREEFGDEGSVRNLTIRYITEHLHGIVDGNTYGYDNWSVKTGIDTTSDVYKKMIRLLQDGALTLPSSKSGRTNIAPITVSMVNAIQ